MAFRIPTLFSKSFLKRLPILPRKMSTSAASTAGGGSAFDPPQAFDGNKDMFGHAQQAQNYAIYRPRYSPQLVEGLLSQTNPHMRSLCVDVACGSGQLTHLLGPHFTRVVGVDKSFEQLKHSGGGDSASTSPSNIEFVAGSAFALPVADHSVDLITVAQAFHWILPHRDFFQEIERAIKPEGQFAIVGYKFPRLLNPFLEALSRHYYVHTLGSEKLPGDEGCFWDISRPAVDSMYEGLTLDRPSSPSGVTTASVVVGAVTFPQPVTRTVYPHVVSMPLRSFFGYLDTMSAYRTLLKRTGSDPLPALAEHMTSSLRSQGVMGGSHEDIYNSCNVEVEIPFYTVTYTPLK